jgi:hypothetical protein
VIRTIQRLATRCNAAADRHWLLLVAAFSALFFYTTLIRAYMKPFWHDEIYTIALAELPSLRTIWIAQRSGLDMMPPLNAVLTHAVFVVAGTGRILTRLPGMTAFWLATLVSFAVVRSRTNALAGLIAMLLLCLSGGLGFAYEARGYGVAIGTFSVALLAWSEAARGHRRRVYLPLLGCALAAGIWTHYYACLAVVPILVGEGVRLARRRAVDWGVFASLAGAGLAILPLYPLARAASAHSATYWRHAQPVDIFEAYASFLGAFYSPWAVALLVCMAATAFVLSRSNDRPRWEWVRSSPHEAAAALATLLVPMLAVLIGVVVTGVFVPRYSVFATVGFAVAVPVVAWNLSPRSGAGELLACALLLAGFGYRSRDVRPSRSLVFENPLVSRPLLVAELSRADPVVVTGTLFLEAWYYAPPARRHSLVYLADPAAALKFVGTDVLDDDYLHLRDWYPVNVQDYPSFVAAHPTFRLYIRGDLAWLPAKLHEDGATIRTIGTEAWATLHEVSIRRPAVAARW